MAHDFGGRVVADGFHGLDQFGSEGDGAGAAEPACVEVEVFLPVFVGLIGVEAAFEIQIEFIVERFPRVGVAGAV